MGAGPQRAGRTESGEKEAERRAVAEDEGAYKSPSHTQGRPGLRRDPVTGTGGDSSLLAPLLQKQLAEGSPWPV